MSLISFFDFNFFPWGVVVVVLSGSETLAVGALLISFGCFVSCCSVSIGLFCSFFPSMYSS